MNIEACWKKAFALPLPSGTRCTLSQPKIPGLKNYYVIALEAPVGSREAEQFFVLAHQTARWLAQLHFADPECYALMYSAGRTRRKPWPHVHIVIADSVALRRRAVSILQLKHVLWWRRWPRHLATLRRWVRKDATQVS